MHTEGQGFIALTSSLFLTLAPTSCCAISWFRLVVLSFEQHQLFISTQHPLQQHVKYIDTPMAIAAYAHTTFS